jgi:hypothetical protein
LLASLGLWSEAWVLDNHIYPYVLGQCCLTKGYLWERSISVHICLILLTDWLIIKVVERTSFETECILVMLLWLCNLNLNIFMFKSYLFFSFPVAPPTRLRYNVISHDSIQISWKAPRGKFGGYKLLVAPASGKESSLYFLRNILCMDG